MTTELMTEARVKQTSVELMTEARVKQTSVDEPAMKEYSVVIDGVIEMVKGLDTMIEYIEKHGAFAGLSMSHREYVDDDTEGTDGKEAT